MSLRQDTNREPCICQWSRNGSVIIDRNAACPRHGRTDTNDAERELRWIDDILDLEGVPRELYSAQGGGVCLLTRTGRVRWLADRRRDAERLLGRDQAACLAERDRWQAAARAHA